MTNRSKKAQLGARVSFRARELAKEAARRASVSLNEWVEQIILDATRDVHVPVQVVPGQLAIEDPAPEGGRFDPSCRNRGYHWMQGPGRPCRWCKGERA